MKKPVIALGILSTAAIGTVAAQQVQLKPPVVLNKGALNVGDLARRFPSQTPPSLRGQITAPPASQWKVNPAAFQIAPQIVATNIAASIKQRFAGKSVGYSVTVIMPNGASAEANGGSARRNPDGAPRGWTGNDRITIASVSKTITAAALIKAMAAKNLSLDMPAFGLLPPGWTYSPSFKTIKVRELLSHNSGIRTCNVDLDSLKACAASTINPADKNPSIPIWTKYNNANFGLMRLMLSRVQDGSIPATAEAQGDRYQFLVNMLVMGPAGVGGSTCAAPAVNPAMSYISTTDDMVWNSTAAQNYNFTSVQPGQPWGDMKMVCGSQGWNLSSRQLATFVNALMFTSKILPQATVATMQQQGLGMMYFNYGGGLSAFGHGGFHPAPNNRGELNTLILGFNNGISIGLIVNSRYNGNFGQDVAEAIRANVK